MADAHAHDHTAHGEGHGHGHGPAHGDGASQAAEPEDPVITAIGHIQKLQNQREETHFLFQRGFGEFLSDKDFERYKLLAHEVTEGFKQVSEDMLFQKSRLEELKRTDLAEMVQDLQAAEHDRLKAVSKVQMLEQEIRGNDVPCNPGDDVIVDLAEQKRDAERLVKQAAQIAADIMADFNYELD